VLAAGLLLALLSAAPVAAHTRLLSADPADGTTVARTPGVVVLTFTEPVIALGTRVVVTGPDGPVASGPAQLVDDTVRQEIAGGAPAGRYTVEWRATSGDGHPVSGQFTFVSEAAATSRPQPSPTVGAPDDPTRSSPAWSWAILASALLAAAGGVALLSRRRRRE